MIKNRLIIVAGPSCVGKSPLDRALKRFYPGLRDPMQPLVLYNSREPRPGEQDGIDYHFRKRESIRELEKDDRYIVMDVRGDLQALDLQTLNDQLGRSEVFFEGNPFIGKLLLTHPGVKHIDKLSVFMSPLSKEEIIYLSTPDKSIKMPSLVTDIMRRKLLRRTRKQKGILSLKDLEDIERRASSAYYELGMAWHFQYVIPNHDGEDSENWDAFYYPVGDARKSLDAFVRLLQNQSSSVAEQWDDILIQHDK